MGFNNFRDNKVDVKPYLEHFGKKISKDLVAYVQDEVLEFSRYIFIERIGSKRFGYCTHCHNEYRLDTKDIPKPIKKEKPQRLCGTLACFGSWPPEPVDKPTMECPFCGSSCGIKYAARGRSNMVDKAYCVFYEKSVKDPNVIVARGMFVVRDYRGDYHNVQTQYSEEARYIFEMGKPGVMLKQECRYTTDPKTKEYKCEPYWGKRATVFSLYKDRWDEYNADYQRSIYYAKIPVAVSSTSIAKSVSGTPFQYSTWEEYINCANDMVKFFELYSKAPCIEYLTKIGFSNLVIEKLQGLNTYRMINWRGKSLPQVLHLTKQEIKDLRAQDINVSFEYLKLMKELKKTSESLTYTEISEILKADYYTMGYRQQMFESMLKYTSIRGAHNYIKQQDNKSDNRLGQSLHTWRDYIRDCEKLEMDLTDPKIVFPSDLERAHQNTILKVKLRADKDLDKKIKARFKELNKKYCFESNGLMIRPAKSAAELIKEGNALHHCVGGYASRYADGGTIILLIRNIKAPNKPFFTMEVGKENRIIQCYGLGNCKMDDRVSQFMEAFKAAKLSKKKNLKKSA